MKDPLPVERITLKSIGENILSVFNLERGIFFTLQQFLFYPKQATHDYLFTEKRRHFVKPINLLLLITGLVVFVILKVAIPDGNGEITGNMPAGISPYWEKILRETAAKVFEYINTVQLLSVPILTSLTYLFFGTKVYNLAEHFVISAFVASVDGVLNLFFLPITFYLDILSIPLTLLLLGYYVFAFMSIFDCKGGKGFLKIAFLLMLKSVLLLVLLGFVFAIYFWFNQM